MSISKGLSTLFFLTTCVGAGYGVWAHRGKVACDSVASAEHDGRTRAAADLATCDHDLATTRAQANDAASTLKTSQGELDALRAERADTEKRLALLSAKFRRMIDSGKLQVTIRHGRMVVKLPAEILFASGSADLSKEGRASIAEVGSILKQVSDRRFEVAGHTDNIPIGPSPFKNNLQLSVARAETVAEQLIASGVSATRLSAAGYSAYEPVQGNATEAGRRENRRIEIVLTPNLAELPSAALDAPKSSASAPSPATPPASVPSAATPQASTPANVAAPSARAMQ